MTDEKKLTRVEVLSGEPAICGATHRSVCQSLFSDLGRGWQLVGPVCLTEAEAVTSWEEMASRLNRGIDCDECEDEAMLHSAIARAEKAEAAAKAGAELLSLAAGDLDDAIGRAEKAEKSEALSERFATQRCKDAETKCDRAEEVLEQWRLAAAVQLVNIVAERDELYSQNGQLTIENHYLRRPGANA